MTYAPSLSVIKCIDGDEQKPNPQFTIAEMKHYFFSLSQFFSSWACQFFNDNYDFGQVFAGNDYVTQIEWCNGNIQQKTEADILNQILNKEKQILTKQLRI